MYYMLGKGTVIPVKWTAPEAILFRKYTTKSDIWSYGMLMYEIWSLGHKPFESNTVQEVSCSWFCSVSAVHRAGGGVSLRVFWCVFLDIYVSMCPCICVSICPCMSSTFCPRICVSMYLCLCFCVLRQCACRWCNSWMPTTASPLPLAAQGRCTLSWWSAGEGVCCRQWCRLCAPSPSAHSNVC